MPVAYTLARITGIADDNLGNDNSSDKKCYENSSTVTLHICNNFFFLMQPFGNKKNSNIDKQAVNILTNVTVQPCVKNDKHFIDIYCDDNEGCGDSDGDVYCADVDNGGNKDIIIPP